MFFNWRKEIKNLFRGGELREYKNHPVLFLYAVGFLAAKKHYTKDRRKTITLYPFISCGKFFFVYLSFKVCRLFT